MARLPDTAPLCLRTGLPGSAKSLRTVEEMDLYVKDGVPVFACNFRELSLPGVIEFADPRKWEELPAGAILYVDEAQRFFPAASGNSKPAYMTAMETIRGTGIRLVLLTQQPDFIHKHIRSLVGAHEHLLRVNGQSKSHVFIQNEVMDNPKSAAAKAKADWATYAFNTRYYAYYKSAETHVIVPRLNRRRAAAIVGLVGAALLGAWSFWSASGGADEPASPGQQSSQSVTVAAPSEKPRGIFDTPDAKPKSTLDLVLEQVPRIPEAPWTAPIFDGRPVVSEPRVFCISSASSCRCMTEQGTPYTLRESSCRYVARNGEPYNPYRKDEPALPATVAANAPGSPPPTAPAADG